MDFSDITKRFDEQFSFTGDKVTEEHRVIEKFLLEAANEKISIWNFWKIFSVVRKLKAAVSLIGNISASCLQEQIKLQETQLNCLEIQKAFQQQVDELKERTKGIGGE